MSGHYEEALRWIKQNRGTGGAGSLAKMVLSLYNSDCGFAFSECIGNLDDNLRELCVKMCAEYSRVGETEELRRVGHELANDLYPILWKHGQAMSDSRQELEKQLDAEHRRRVAEEREENRADETIIKQHDILRGTYSGPYS